MKMDRRSFLKTTGAAVVAGALPMSLVRVAFGSKNPAQDFTFGAQGGHDHRAKAFDLRCDPREPGIGGDIGHDEGFSGIHDSAGEPFPRL